MSDSERPRIDLPSEGPGHASPEARVDRAIAVQEERGTSASSLIPWDDVKAAVRHAAKARLLPRDVTPEAAIVAAATGAELGIKPFQAIRTIDVIDGRATLRAQTMLGLAYKRLPGFDYSVTRWDLNGCKVKGRRSKEHSEIEVEFTREDGKRAGLLGKKNWAKHPRQMLWNRAVAMLLRAVAPDVFAGIYDPDEAEDMGPIDADALVEVEDAPTPSHPADVPAATGVEVVDTDFTPHEPTPEVEGAREDADAKMAERREIINDLRGMMRTGGEVKAAAGKLGLTGRKPSELSIIELRQLYAEARGEPSDPEVL